MKVKLVSVSFTVDFCHDVFVVIISESSTEFVIIHIRFAFSLSPTSCNFVRICQLEFAVGSFPSDAGRVGAIRQQFQQELPQLNLSTSYKKEVKLAGLYYETCKLDTFFFLNLGYSFFSPRLFVLH